MTMSKKSSRWKVKSRDEMSPIEVIFVSDTLVEEIIPTRKVYDRMQAKKAKEVQQQLDQEQEVGGRKRKAEEEGQQAVPIKKGKLAENFEDVESALAALDSVKYLSPKVATATSLKNSKSTVKLSNGDSNLTAISEESSTNTSYSLRRRVKDIEKIQKILENSDNEGDFSGSESDYSESSSSSSSSEDDESPVKNKFHGAQAYFFAKKIKKLQSNSQPVPNLTQQQTEEILRGLVSNAAHRSHIKLLLRSYSILFNKWDTLLRNNFNVLLHGVGSKKNILERFLQRLSSKYLIITVNGYFPSVSTQDILERLCDPLRVDASSLDALETVENILKEHQIIFYVGINNIDGVMLRNKRSLSFLSRLAKNPCIRVIASLDHINAPLMWDHCFQTDFNWATFDITTYIPYTEETKYEGTLLSQVQSGGRVTLTSLRSVFHSLPRNARGVFLTIVRAQLENGSSFAGLSFRELYKSCKGQMLVSSDTALRASLKEFIDHTIIKQKRSAEGDEIYVVNVDTAILREFAAEHSDDFS